MQSALVSSWHFCFFELFVYSSSQQHYYVYSFFLDADREAEAVACRTTEIECFSISLAS